jgi:hypothetical protein
MAGSVGDDIDLDLEMFAVKEVGGFLHQSGEAVLVGPHHVLDVEVDAVVAVFPAFAQEGGVHGVLRLRVAEQLVDLVVVEDGEERNEGDVRVMRGLQNGGLRFAGD